MTGLTLIVIAIVYRQPLPVALIVAVFSLLVVSVGSAESVHWRWSRGEFELAAAEEKLPCDSSEGCRVGWWDATDVEDFGSFTIVWTELGCYAGQGFAVPTDPGATREAIASVLNEQPGARFEVRDWHDGWFEVCGRT